MIHACYESKVVYLLVFFGSKLTPSLLFFSIYRTLAIDSDHTLYSQDNLLVHDEILNPASTPCKLTQVQG